MSHDVMWPIGEERKKWLYKISIIHNVNHQSSDFYIDYRNIKASGLKHAESIVALSLFSRKVANSICFHHQMYKLWSVQLDNTLQKSSINQIRSLGEMRKNADPGSGSALIYCASATLFFFFSFFLSFFSLVFSSSPTPSNLHPFLSIYISQAFFLC